MTVVPSVRRWHPGLRLGAVAAVLSCGTACLEHVEALRTRVTYDPYSQTFRVERRLVDVEARFLGCRDVDDCVEAIERTLTMAPNPTLSMSLSDRLLQRLIDSGATDVVVTLERDEDQLDILVEYSAAVGSPAADDTLVRAEWSSNGFPFGHYYLVVTAQDAMETPGRHQTRKVARSGATGIDWIEEWLLPRHKRSVETTLTIDESDDASPLFAEVPGLDAALQERGWLDAPVSLDATVVADASAEPTTFAALAPDETQAPGEPIEAGPDPSSPAKTWVYEARVSGGGVTAAAAAVAIEPLIPALSRCYQLRQRDIPTLEGNVFLSALVKEDGSVVATSVSGGLSDPTLLACIDRVLARWSFGPWGEGDGVSDVAIPVVFRVEDGPGRNRK